MKEQHKSSMEHQSRLNPIMKEVVRKEVIECLNEVIIFPILDNKWVSHVKYVPQKRGMTIVVNE